MWQIALSGRQAQELSPEDLAGFNRPRGGHAEGRRGWAALSGVETWGWKHYVRLLQVNNIGLPEDTWSA
jgi:hypothetical protein